MIQAIDPGHFLDKRIFHVNIEAIGRYLDTPTGLGDRGREPQAIQNLRHFVCRNVVPENLFQPAAPECQRSRLRKLFSYDVIDQRPRFTARNINQQFGRPLNGTLGCFRIDEWLAGTEEPNLLGGLGLTLYTPEVAPVFDQVVDDSPAERAGLKSGDRALTADGLPLAD